MARPTLADVRRQALFFADLIKGNTIEREDANARVNAALKTFHNKMTGSAGGEDYVLVTYTLPTIADTESYTLPEDFKQLREIFLVSGNNRIALDRAALRDIGGHAYNSWTSTWPYAPTFKYRLTGQRQITFYPKPSGSLSVELWYIPECTTLVQDSDELPLWVAAGWEEYVSVCAAIDMLLRLQLPVGELAQREAQLWQTILTDIKPRDKARAHRVIDVYRTSWRDESDY